MPSNVALKCCDRLVDAERFICPFVTFSRDKRVAHNVYQQDTLDKNE